VTSESIRVTAPAKINLYLAVGATRPDGFHDVTTVLQALEFGDEVRLSPAEALTFTCDADLGIPAEENLAVRAARALGEEFGRQPAVAIALTKRVPHGAGLGGGSSDAAAVLQGLAHLWELDPQAPRMYRVASALGSDVPFFLKGGAALFDGRGERFVRSLPTVALDVALVRPPEAVSTRAAYAAFDALARKAAPGPRHVTDGIRFQEPDALGAALYNNMTDAAITLVPAIADALALGRGIEGVYGSALCGSGSAVFALCQDGDTAERLVSAARERGWWGVATRTSGAGTVVEAVEE